MPLDNYVPATSAGLEQVYRVGDWRSVVDISTKLMKDEDFSSREKDELSTTLQYRFEGLFKMKMFDDLMLEVGRFLQAEGSTRDATSIDALSLRPNAMSLSVLVCEVMSLTGRGGEAIEQLYKLRRILEISLSSKDSEASDLLFQWWYYKIWNQIVNVLLRQRQWHLALHELSRILSIIRNMKLESGAVVGNIL